MEAPRKALLAAIGAALAAAALLFSLRLAPLPRVALEGSGSACKAVTSAAEARGCLGVEVDLNLTSDGVWVLNHDADFRGRPLAAQTWAEVKDGLVSLDDFAQGTAGERFAAVNVDLKERSFWPGKGTLTKALSSHAAALRSLSKHGLVIISSPVPARYAELHRFLARARWERVTPALELFDYSPAQAERWGLPLTRWEKAAMPAARLATGLYQRLNAKSIPWLTLQESTALGVLPPGGSELLCWTRDGETGAWPPACPWTTRTRETARKK